MVQQQRNIFFGTDGMRGAASDFSQQGLFQLGYYLSNECENGRVLIGDDGRESSQWMREALERGIEKSGGVCEYAGLLPTPLLSQITRFGEYERGIMITASHNEWYDNGIKLFDNYGRKIDSTLERTLEHAYYNTKFETLSARGKFDSYSEFSSYQLYKNYIHMIQENINASSLEGKILIDCANGATSEIIKEIFEGTTSLQADVICNSSNGENINYNCGIIHPLNISNYMQSQDKEYLLAVSFDGDGDRVGLHDERGIQINGDFLIAFLAQRYNEHELLHNKGVVITEYSNGSLSHFLRDKNIDVHKVINSDKAVLNMMRNKGLSFGGEQSGHLLCNPNASCGDGLFAMSEIVKYLQPKVDVSEQVGNLFLPTPQVLRDVKFYNGVNRDELMKQCQEQIQYYNEELKEKYNGRVFVRASGTEPKFRILTEGDDKEYVNEVTDKLSRLIANNMHI